tara:strand:+ start:1689 stop:1925 length:237 start_codon:yes stop_codon:yes gene_type:complete
MSDKNKKNDWAKIQKEKSDWASFNLYEYMQEQLRENPERYEWIIKGFAAPSFEQRRREIKKKEGELKQRSITHNDDSI